MPSSSQVQHPSTAGQRRSLLSHGLALLSIATILSGCDFLPKSQAQPQSNAAQNQQVAVDVAVAKPDLLRQPREYTGTTQPLQEVSLRSQAEGQVLRLEVNVGDRVETGQILGEVDRGLLQSAVVEAEAELATRQAAVAQAQTQFSEAETRVEQARLELQQAEADAARYERLAESGAGTRQQAEQFRTRARTAAQVVRSSQQQVSNQQGAIAAAEGRVAAQEALIVQAQERESFALLRSPISGSVLQKVSEVGNLVQPGGEVLKLGDFSSVKVIVQVSELELSSLQVGRSVQVRLDSLPNQQFTGTVSRISPAADPVARLIPVEVLVANPTGKIGSGLLARVNFGSSEAKTVVVPNSAVQEKRARQAQQPAQPGAQSGQGGQNPPRAARSTPDNAKQGRPQRTEGVVFVVTGEGEAAKVEPRSVKLGQQGDGKTQILSGLNPGDRYVARSGRPLKGGESVRLSLLSEK
ncbi:MAG TPA: efflux RND transporter periplasmic adaptor subunit [Thermosynechococcaceae cyanobacterium]